MRTPGAARACEHGLVPQREFWLSELYLSQGWGKLVSEVAVLEHLEEDKDGEHVKEFISGLQMFPEYRKELRPGATASWLARTLGQGARMWQETERLCKADIKYCGMEVTLQARLTSLQELFGQLHDLGPDVHDMEATQESQKAAITGVLVNIKEHLKCSIDSTCVHRRSVLFTKRASIYCN